MLWVRRGRRTLRVHLTRPKEMRHRRRSSSRRNRYCRTFLAPGALRGESVLPLGLATRTTWITGCTRCERWGGPPGLQQQSLGEALSDAHDLWRNRRHPAQPLGIAFSRIPLRSQTPGDRHDEEKRESLRGGRVRLPVG